MTLEMSAQEFELQNTVVLIKLKREEQERERQRIAEEQARRKKVNSHQTSTVSFLSTSRRSPKRGKHSSREMKLENQRRITAEALDHHLPAPYTKTRLINTTDRLTTFIDKSHVANQLTMIGIPEEEGGCLLTSSTPRDNYDIVASLN